MLRRMVAARFALAVLVVLGLAGPVAAGEQVPFKGAYEGEDTWVTIPTTAVPAATSAAPERLAGTARVSRTTVSPTARPIGVVETAAAARAVAQQIISAWGTV